ncbi:MAG: DUF805 domain-containing protein [Bacteroidota bacterium]
MEWYLKALKSYADFSGRARRKEYWMYILFHLLILLALAFSSSLAEGVMGINVGAMVIMIYALGTVIPTLAVMVRRLHDTNRSGWWFMIRFVPLVGDIILLIFLVSEGDNGDNNYGPDPKADFSVFDRIDEIGE